MIFPSILDIARQTVGAMERLLPSNRSRIPGKRSRTHRAGDHGVNALLSFFHVHAEIALATGKRAATHRPDIDHGDIVSKADAGRYCDWLVNHIRQMIT